VAFVELALVMPFIALLCFGAIDLGRMAKFQNRMSNTARESGAILQLFPTSVNTGCRGDRNAVDRAARQDSGLTSVAGYSLTVAKKGSGGVLTPYTGCGTAIAPNGTEVSIEPGDHIVVTITADVKLVGPFNFAFSDGIVHLKRSTEVVVQG
jgi:Flp pilus assembly protein TadG